MKQNICAPSVPTAHIAVNKSRIKLYNKAGDMPTFYLQKNQEFQIEIFNPTSDVILAKIELNGKSISQGGLVLNPGQRVFLDRYLDVPQKFLFDTYEVSNTTEVKKAIENNGDIKVEFYKEQKYYIPTPSLKSSWPQYDWTFYGNGTDPNYITNGILINELNIGPSTPINNSVNCTSNFYNIDTSSFYNSNITCISSNSDQKNLLLENSVKSEPMRSKKSLKSIETGRVEMGSHSNQEFEYINKDFAYLPFHTVKYKLLPVSQKVNTVADVNVKRYCTNCGHKLSKTDKFCSNCGKKA